MNKLHHASVDCYVIRRAAPPDIGALAPLAALLWPDAGQDALAEEFAHLLSVADAALFVAEHTEEPVGFAHCQLRHDYVEGTDSSPVGYLEGVYVLPEHRRQRVGVQLVRACEAWALARGCTEFASDCELHNMDSLRFHLAAGFTEANRLICFHKRLR